MHVIQLMFEFRLGTNSLNEVYYGSVLSMRNTLMGELDNLLVEEFSSLMIFFLTGFIPHYITSKVFDWSRSGV